MIKYTRIGGFPCKLPLLLRTFNTSAYCHLRNVSNSSIRARSDGPQKASSGSSTNDSGIGKHLPPIGGGLDKDSTADASEKDSTVNSESVNSTTGKKDAGEFSGPIHSSSDPSKPDESPGEPISVEPIENLEDILEEDLSLVKVENDAPSVIYYFDTHKVYSMLKFSGFTEGQADVLMETIKTMLDKRLKECKEDSFPVYAGENEAYLFEAACSELKTEIQAARQRQNGEIRSAISRLQRDSEIMYQEGNEMISTMKYDLEMLVNDRKDSTRSDESIIQLRIQELNNKITLDIQSDAKSEIESLRWATTRRGLVCVLVVALSILVLSSAAKSDDKVAKKKLEYPTEDIVMKVPTLSTSEVDDGPEDQTVDELK